MTPIGDFRPYPKAFQARKNATKLTPEQKRIEEANARQAGVEAATDSRGVMRCYLCKKAIRKGERWESDHIDGRRTSREQRPTHKACHEKKHNTGEGRRAAKKAREELKK